MKTFENGKIREMTPEEVREMQQIAAELPPAPSPSLEETVQKQAQEIADLQEALNALLERRVQ